MCMIKYSQYTVRSTTNAAYATKTLKQLVYLLSQVTWNRSDRRFAHFEAVRGGTPLV